MAAKRTTTAPARTGRPVTPGARALLLPRASEPGRDDFAARALLAWGRSYRPEQTTATTTNAGGVMVHSVVPGAGYAQLLYEPDPRFDNEWRFRGYVSRSDGSPMMEFAYLAFPQAKRGLVDEVEELEAEAKVARAKTAARESKAEEVSGYGARHGYALVGGTASYDPTISWDDGTGQYVRLYFDSHGKSPRPYFVRAYTHKLKSMGEAEGKLAYEHFEAARRDFERRIADLRAAAPAPAPVAPAMPARGTQLRLFANPAPSAAHARLLARVLDGARAQGAAAGVPLDGFAELTEDRAGPLVRLRITSLPAAPGSKPRALLDATYVQTRLRGENPYGLEPMSASWRGVAGTITRALHAHGLTLAGKPVRVVYRFEPGAIEARYALEAQTAPRSLAPKGNPVTPHQHSGRTQTFIVPKTAARTLTEARALAKRHHAVHLAADETGTSYRFRQRDPEDFKPGTFRTYDVGDGVKVVVGELRAAVPKANPAHAGRVTRATLARSAGAVVRATHALGARR